MRTAGNNKSLSVYLLSLSAGGGSAFGGKLNCMLINEFWASKKHFYASLFKNFRGVMRAYLFYGIPDMRHYERRIIRILCSGRNPKFLKPFSYRKNLRGF